MSLTQMTQDYILSQSPGSPIFIDDIVVELNKQLEEDEKKVRQNITVICSRLLERLDGFYRFDVGIYYYTTDLEGSINHCELTQRLYIENKQGDIFGVLTGNSLAFRCGLINKQPRLTHIMTNNWRRAQKCSKEEAVKLVAPQIEITNDNVFYFEVLELIKWNPTLIDEELGRLKVIELIRGYKLHSIKLMAYAVSYYNQKVVLAVAKLAPVYIESKNRIVEHDTPAIE